MGRTATVVGCLLASGGMDADNALAQITRFRADTRKAHRRAPETPSQIEIIRARAAESDPAG